MSKKRVGTKKSAPKKAAVNVAQAAMATAKSSRTPAKERAAALTKVPLAVCESDASLQAMLKILRNKDEAIDVRLTTLQAIQAASFSVVAFESCRADYLAALREVATDANPELRQRALGMLAREKDGFAQKKLLEGLKNPEKALVSPEKALQLLSYDVHADAYQVARSMVNKPPNALAKREALRLLAADASAAPVFEKILRDKEEPLDLRQISASALHSMKPEKLQAHARELLLDNTEEEGIQAISLTALTQFGQPAAIAKDAALMKRVEALGGGAGKIKQPARQFLTKYNP
jgi:hypothetical protein